MRIARLSGFAAPLVLIAIVSMHSGCASSRNLPAPTNVSYPIPDSIQAFDVAMKLIRQRFQGFDPDQQEVAFTVVRERLNRGDTDLLWKLMFEREKDLSRIRITIDQLGTAESNVLPDRMAERVAVPDLLLLPKGNHASASISKAFSLAMKEVRTKHKAYDPDAESVEIRVSRCRSESTDSGKTSNAWSFFFDREESSARMFLIIGDGGEVRFVPSL